jgi:hypothetical protein
VGKRTADPSASSGFPVRLSGFGEPHTAFFRESRIRGRFESSVVGNPESARDDKWGAALTSAAVTKGWAESVRQLVVNGTATVARLTEQSYSGPLCRTTKDHSNRGL